MTSVEILMLKNMKNINKNVVILKTQNRYTYTKYKNHTKICMYLCRTTYFYVLTQHIKC